MNRNQVVWPRLLLWRLAASSASSSATALSATSRSTAALTATTTAAAATLWEVLRVRVLEAGGFDVVTNGGIAFVAGVLVHVVIGLELPREFYRPRARQYRGIFNGHFVFDRFRTGASEPLYDTHVL